ncbi:MAG: division/cell wall cluster transcriptional repressor MraZ [Treponema sp.]|nr:division/cell wall cluster transcriptional repressor MraZ [Treponema sp.]
MELNRGSAESTLDDKGRVSIPVRFREYFQGELIITRGMEHCAWIMTPAVWERFEKAFRNSGTLTQEERLSAEDKYLNQAQVVELDKAGRIAIPSSIRKYASLTKECMVIRDENRLSIWDSGAFEAYLAARDEITRSAMNKLGSQDIFRAL